VTWSRRAAGDRNDGRRRAPARSRAARPTTALLLAAATGAIAALSCRARDAVITAPFFEGFDRAANNARTRGRR